jgi:hypothetical protein
VAPLLVDAESGEPSRRCSNFCPSSGLESGACVPATPAGNATMSLDEQRTMMALLDQGDTDILHCHWLALTVIT